MARKLVVEIVGDARSLEKAFDKSSRSAKNFDQDMGRTGKSGSKMFGGLAGAAKLATGAIGVAGFAGAAKLAFTEMADAQKVAAQTEAVLKSTGGTANVSAGQVDKLADNLMRLSGVDDEAIKSGENLLLTFTNIRNQAGKGNKIFDRATETMLDMSVALGQDTTSSAMQLGKALNDPAKGIGALRRIGVTFTKDQIKLVKSLVASGDELGAQKIILEELQKEFGGSAEAAGNTLPGKLNILRESVTNLAGSIAEVLTPKITEIVEKLIEWMSNTENQQAVLDTFKAVVEVVADVLEVLRGAFEAVNTITGSTRTTVKLLIGTLIAFKALKMISYLAGMTKQMKLFGKASGTAAGMGALGGGGGAGGGKFGKAAGAVGAVAVGAPLVAQGIRKIPGWDDFWGGVGGKIADATVGRSPNLAVAGAGARPAPIILQVDGRELGRATSRQQTRTGRRTAKQTSGLR